MTEEKQIKEMACAMCGSNKICVGEDVEKCILYPTMRKYANNAYREGYRKSSEVAREIFEELEKNMVTFGDVALSSYFKGIGWKHFKELKKKYTEPDAPEGE